MGYEDIKLKATSDMFIKYLFGMDTEQSNHLVMSFINSVLEHSDFPRITKVIQKNPFNYKEFTDDKLSVLDIKVEDENQRVFNIEVQSAGDYGFRNRALYYWAKLYTSKLKNGDEYEKLLPTISINILDFMLFPDLNEYHNYFMITEAQNGEYLLSDHLIIHFLELPKITESEKSSKLVHWLLYFKQEGKENEMLKYLINDDDDIKQAHEKYEDFNNDQQLRWAAIDREKAIRDKIYHENIAKRKGREEGLKQGLAEGLKKGHEEGRIEGQLDEKRETFRRLFTLKFGENRNLDDIIKNENRLYIFDKATDLILTTSDVGEIFELFNQ